MESRWTCIFSTLLLANLLLLPNQAASSSDQQYLSVPSSAGIPFEFRPAVLDDIDDFTTVVIDAFSPGPAWKYVYQFQDEYPGYTWHCMRDQWKLLFGRSHAGVDLDFRVITVPDETAKTGSRVVSISVWDFNKTNDTWPSSSAHLQKVPAFGSLFHLLATGMGPGANLWANCSLHLDVNSTQAVPWVGAVRDAEQKYCDDVFERRAELGGLATHPKWDGHGFAAVHLNWGLKRADQLGLSTSLTGTPAAHSLYRSVGFEDIHNVTHERLDGNGTIWYEIMVHPGKNGTD